MSLQSHSNKARLIGVFGGTFDPVHLGHLILAERAREELALDAIIFVPALIPPHKRNGRTIALAEHRLAMLELAVGSNSAFIISDHEINRDGISYTVDTLRYLQTTAPELSMTLLIGADNAEDFRNWHQPDQIVELARVAVWARPEVALPSEILPGIELQKISAPLLEISSTDIRRRVATGRSIRYMTLDSITEYIFKHGLYR